MTPNRECPGWPGRVRAVTLLLVASALVAGVAASCAAPQPGPRSDAQPATTSEVQPVPGSDSDPASTDGDAAVPTTTTTLPDPVALTLAGMDTRRKAAQLLVAGFAGTAAPPELLELLREGPVGGAILFERNIRDPEQLAALTAALQAAAAAGGSGVPLLVAVDQEGGSVRRVREGVPAAPGARVAAQTMTIAAVEDLAWRVGGALLRLGVNTNLAPVADVVEDPASFLYGRSYGSDPETVGSYVAAVIEGQERAGLISAVKHFPGHGSAVGDSHLGTVASPDDLDRFMTWHLPPFREAIRVGVPMVMVSHVVATGLGESIPSSVSPGVIGGLLRATLGFGGVVITDDVEMAGSLGGDMVALDAVVAGADMVIVGHDYAAQRAALESLVTGVEQGRLSTARLDEAVTRVLRLKQAYGLLTLAAAP